MTSVTVSSSPRRDLGRVAFVPICCLLLLVNSDRIVSTRLFTDHVSLRSLAIATSAALTMTFYALTIRAYVRRPPAAASSSALTVNAAALVATALPLVIPLLKTQTTDVVEVVCGDVLMLAGLAWSVWSLRTLGRSFSVIPQARAVVSSGPYRIARHPLYLGEIVATLGLALVRPSVATLGTWLLLFGLQVYRATREEALLASTLPGYDEYRSRTRRLIPGLY